MNKQKFSSERVLMLKDPTRSFPAGPDKEPLGVLKWRRVYAATDEDDVPLRSTFPLRGVCCVCVCVRVCVCACVCVTFPLPHAHGP